MQGEEAREEWEEIKDHPGTETQKQLREEVCRGRRGARTEATQAWLLLFLPVTLS